MARRSRLTADEITIMDESKKAEAENAARRKSGFELMSARDRGWGHLKDHANGRKVVMAWHSDRELLDGELRDYVPEGMFKLVIEGKTYLFSQDEFLKLSRWV